MSDTNDNNYTNGDENPFVVADADKPVDEVGLEDCYWDSDEMDVLQDAYMILRDAGFSMEEIQPLGALLNNTTIYTVTRTEMVYDEFVATDE